MENQNRFEDCTSCGMKVPTKNKYTGNGFKCRDCREEMKKMKGKFQEKKLSSYVKNPFHEKKKQNQTPNENTGERRTETCYKCSTEVETLNTYTGSNFMCPTCREDGKRMIKWKNKQNYLQHKFNRKNVENNSNVGNQFSVLNIENGYDTEEEEENISPKQEIVMDKSEEEFPSLVTNIKEKKSTTSMNFSKAIKTVVEFEKPVKRTEVFVPKLYQREVSKLKNISFSNISRDHKEEEEEEEEDYQPKPCYASNSWGNDNFAQVSWGYDENTPSSWDDE
jgi:predicted RNA-binding Zn-ribbon protein involved in translation (DUF1610 family)